MKLQEIRCPHCKSGDIEIDTYLKVGMCKYCRSKFFLIKDDNLNVYTPTSDEIEGGYFKEYLQDKIEDLWRKHEAQKITVWSN